MRRSIPIRRHRLDRNLLDRLEAGRALRTMPKMTDVRAGSVFRLVGGDQFFVAANATYSKRGTAMPRCFHQKAPKDIDATTISAVRFNTTRLIQALMGKRSSLSSATIANKSLSPSRPCAAVIPIAVRDVECSGVQRHGRIPLS
jgi:hypothetical protein